MPGPAAPTVAGDLAPGPSGQSAGTGAPPIDGAESGGPTSGARDVNAAGTPPDPRGPSAPPPPDPAALTSWTQRMVALLRQKIRYPRAAEADQLEGSVLVRISLDPTGSILAVVVAKTSGEALLDREAVHQVRALARLAAPPDATPRTVEVPIDFVLPVERR